MRRSLCAAAIAGWVLILLPFNQRAEAAVVVKIDRASQTMEVSVDGMPRYNWRLVEREGMSRTTIMVH